MIFILLIYVTLIGVAVLPAITGRFNPENGENTTPTPETLLADINAARSEIGLEPMAVDADELADCVMPGQERGIINGNIAVEEDGEAIVNDALTNADWRVASIRIDDSGTIIAVFN